MKHSFGTGLAMLTITFLSLTVAAQDKVVVGQAIPAVISFDWQVDQLIHDQEEKTQKHIQYLFSTNGGNTAMHETGDEASGTMMIYLADGRTLLVNEKSKTIMVMAMHRVMGEMGMAGKEMAEKISGNPLAKDKDDETMVAVKTGKTKQLLTYTAEEYQCTAKNGKGTMSFWYAKVPFDPVKAYTMGAGRPANLSKITGDPKLKNSVFAVPLLNPNYLWVETEAGGQKGMETVHIDKKTTTINTAGYRVQYIGGMKDMMKAGTDND